MVARRPLSSDLSLEPISAPNASIIDMVEDAAEEMFDTIPGASRRELEQKTTSDPTRTAEMDQAVLERLLPKTRPENPQTVAMRPPREEPQTEPSMPVELVEQERLIAHVTQPKKSPVLKVVVAGLIFGAAAASLWFMG